MLLLCVLESGWIESRRVNSAGSVGVVVHDCCPVLNSQHSVDVEFLESLRTTKKALPLKKPSGFMALGEAVQLDNESPERPK